MSKRHAVVVAMALLLALPIASRLIAQAPAARPASTGAVAIAEYERALGLQAKFSNKALDVAEPVVWLSSGKFWYRKSVTGGNAFVLVDPVALKKAPAFDHTKVAAGLSAAAAKPYTAATLPF